MAKQEQNQSDTVSRHASRRRRIALLDPRFVSNWRQYVFQCLFVTATIAVVLVLLDSVYQTVLIAALGASSFVAFGVPSLRASRPRCMLGGYLVGVSVGAAISLLASVVGGTELLSDHTVDIMFGALAVGLAMFIMVVTNTEHPPAAAVALGFVLNAWDLMTIVVVLTGILSITLVKESVRGRLIDLF